MAPHQPTGTSSDPEPLDFLDSTHVQFRGRRWLYFGGCNYLGLSWHPALRNAVSEGAKVDPLQPGASRFTTGEHSLYLQCEGKLASFFQQEAALLVPTGYLAPIAVCQGLAAELSHVLLDDQAHACVADGAILTGRPVLRFPHADLKALRRLIASLPREHRVLLATDGVAGIRGGISPLQEYLRLLPAKGRMLVDDAHGAGTVGPGGRGALAHLGVQDPRILMTCSLAKALGASGGAVLGERGTVEEIRRKAAAAVGTTPMPLPLARAVLASLKLLSRSSARVKRLQANARLFCELCPATEEIACHPDTPVIGVFPASATRADRYRAALERHDIHPPWIRYVTGPASGFFRLSLCADHNPAQVRQLAKALLEAALHG